MRGFNRLFVAIATLAGLALAASPAKAQTIDPELVARARKDARVTIYSSFSGNDLHAAIKKSFEETYGVGVDLLMGRSSDITERVRAEAAASRVLGDVALHGEATLERMRADGLTLASARDGGPNAAPAFINAYGLMVNVNLVPPADRPKSWLDLLEPRWSGKLLADDMRALGSGGMFFAASIEKIGVDFQRRLAGQKIVFGRDIGADQLRVARGEFPMRFPQSLSNMHDLRGLPLEFIIPREGLPYIRIDAASLTGARHPDAARLFVAHMRQPKTQAMLAGFDLVPVIDGAAGGADPLVARARETLMGTFHPETQEAMLKLAREIYK